MMMSWFLQTNSVFKFDLCLNNFQPDGYFLGWHLSLVEALSAISYYGYNNQLKNAGTSEYLDSWEKKKRKDSLTDTTNSESTSAGAGRSSSLSGAFGTEAQNLQTLYSARRLIGSQILESPVKLIIMCFWSHYT